MYAARLNLTLNLASNICKLCTARVAQPLKRKKPKSTKTPAQSFVDLKLVRTVGGKGGNGCISFLHLWSNEFAGPDGGDGGNGGHVIFETNTDIKDLLRVPKVIEATDGEPGRNKDCHGKNAPHNIIPVPVGTIIKNVKGKVIGDLAGAGFKFVAARGGAGGKGNHFFISDTQQSPEICEYGASGEDLEYILEIKGMAHMGLIGFPNAGKSTLLQAISRARPKIAPYPFTTLKPYIGMIQYDDYEQIAVADLPGLIPDSHKNKGLGIQFLKHAERCSVLLFVVDVSKNEPSKYLDSLQYELLQFSDYFAEIPQIVVANKIDLPGAEGNVEELRRHTELKVVPISAKMGSNLHELLTEMKILYDKHKKQSDFSI